ncbi:MAG: DUF748 domain-containing protein [Gammaproteobacteria bacterium]|nr:DUF748 domain-containing protein [Gammaproteobacteria bacterium]
MQKPHPVVKKLLLIIFSIAVLMIVILGVLPYVINWAAVYWLEQQGVAANIEKIDIDYNDAVLNIVNASGHNAAGKGFVIGQFKVDMAWRPLLSHTAKIENIVLSDFELDIEQGKEGELSIAGIALPMDSEQGAYSKKDTDIQSEAWKVQLGNIFLNNIKSCYEFKNKHFCTSLDKFDWQGHLSFDGNKPGASQPEINSSLALNMLVIYDEKRHVELFSNKSLNLEKLLLKGINDIRLNGFQVRDLVILPVAESAQPAHNIMQLDSIQINQLQFSDQQKLDIQQLIFKGIGVSIFRDKQAHWEVVQQLDYIMPEDVAEDQQQSAPEQNKISPLTVKIGELLLLDSRRISFSDQSLATPFNLSAMIKEFRLSEIDTSDAKQSSKMKLQMVADKHGSIDMAGDIQLFADARSFNVTGKILGIDLRPISSYLESVLGHRIKSGQLNADVKLVSRQGKMDSSIELDLKQFKLKALTDEEQEKLNQKMELGMPLDTALNLLRDRDNSIKLKLPVTGDANQPDFDPSDVIYKATSKAMTVAIINFYTPFGLVHAAQGLLDLATALRFEPLKYEAGVSEATPAQYQSLNKIVLLMTERPMLHLTICGYASVDDLATISAELYEQRKEKPDNFKLDESSKKQLIGIASKRSEAVKAYLIKQNVAADRLILCEPEFDAADAARVEISI